MTTHLERQLARLRDQLAILASARPTPEQLAGEDTADKDMARRIHQARPGIPIHHILATLEAFRAVLEMAQPGYCPSCGRGDVTPTAEEYEQQRQRALEAEAALDRVRAVPDHPLAQPAPPDHEQVGYVKGWMAASAAYLAALDGEQPAPAPAATEATSHIYLSTGCLHGHHDYCQSHTGRDGTKTPAQCKFCAAPCTCGCHQHDVAQPADRPKEQQERPTHPDGTPYRYHEIAAERWEHCDGCGLWGQWTVANPHECANDRVQPADQTKEQ
ncbi:hypothetical protein ACPCUF_23835 [Streptomyces griseoincarnatus]